MTEFIDSVINNYKRSIFVKGVRSPRPSRGGAGGGVCIFLRRRGWNSCSGKRPKRPLDLWSLDTEGTQESRVFTPSFTLPFTPPPTPPLKGWGDTRRKPILHSSLFTLHFPLPTAAPRPSRGGAGGGVCIFLRRRGWNSCSPLKGRGWGRGLYFSSAQRLEFLLWQAAEELFCYALNSSWTP